METAAQWQRPWRPTGLATRPVSVTSGKAYRGINALILGMSEHASPYWGTFKAWKDKGASVRKGEKGTLIVFYKPITVKEERDGEETEKDVLMARGYYVFNASQVDGWTAPEEAKFPEGEKIARIEEWVAKTGVPVKHGGDRAFYVPSRDYVQMPPRGAFHETAGYVSVLMHELTHSSGHKD